MTNPACLFFRPMATNPDICARWIRPDTGPKAITQFEPFCAADISSCPTQGMRLMPRVDQEDDGWQDSVDLGVR